MTVGSCFGDLPGCVGSMQLSTLGLVILLGSYVGVKKTLPQTTLRNVSIGGMIVGGLILLRAAAPIQAHSQQPGNSMWVDDTAHILTVQQEDAMVHELIALHQRTGVSVVVVAINELPAGLSPEQYTTGLMRSRGIGSREKDGVMILVDMKDHLVRIEPGNHQEGDIPDGTIKLILHDDVGPRFHTGDFYGGLEAAIRDISGILIKAADAGSNK